ncbi:hypothetical protein SASPL_152778 [Salvia splendens]|uniref:Uncharacterized protein n=1 Tax=Salvia splendens TaxID=180675 RepID=A0A8X8W4I7_SALSN|nr:uncharacterized protein LOC121784362 [Salvia splendens]KAG6387586.1 hypothetical protein SASPL_152778 [Salvia splendens]
MKNPTERGNSGWEMERDIVIQLGILMLTLAIFYLLLLHTLPKRSKSRTNNQAHRHFIAGAQLLARARSTKTKSFSFTLAKSALDEADKALALDPRDPAAHILKAMAQTLMGHKAPALKSLDVALSPPAAKALSHREKGDALVRRADLLIGLNRKRRVDSALADLEEAVGLSPDNSRGFLFVGPLL